MYMYIYYFFYSSPDRHTCNLAFFQQPIFDLTRRSTHQNLVGIHWPRQEEGSIVRCVELVAEDVDGGNPLYVVLCAQVGGQKAAKLNQGVVTLRAQRSKRVRGQCMADEQFPVKAGAGSGRRWVYLVVKVSDEFQVVLSALQEHDAVSLLGHEETQRQRQLVVQQHVLQPLGRLLGVPDLAEVASLFWKSRVDTRRQ